MVAKWSILVSRRRVKTASSTGNICLVLVLIAVTAFSVSLSSAPLSYSQQKQQVTLTAMLDDQGDPPRLLRMLFEPALKELQAKHPDLDIKLDYRPFLMWTYVQSFLRQ
jgi:hypothetical protein